MMAYKEILEMVSNSAYNQFFKGLNYGGLQNTLVECATKIYIAQMQLEKRNYKKNMTIFMRDMTNFLMNGQS